MRWRCD